MTRETAKRKIEMLDSYLQRVTDYGENDHEAMMMAIKALEQQMTDYKRAFKIACELLNGSCLYGVDSEKIFEIMMNKDGIVDNESYEKYILSHMDELDHGQYVSQSESEE